MNQLALDIRKPTQTDRIRSVLADGAWRDTFTLSRESKVSPYSIRTRLSEMRVAGEVESQRTTVDGISTSEWRIATDGRAS